MAIHGSKCTLIRQSDARYICSHVTAAQEERQYAIKSFKSGQKDVMVASGVASKGLDFNDIQHVIIFSMPKEIEDYVHQIGRTGRSGKTGIATTFVNMNTPEQTLLDLKYLLMEAGQKFVVTLVPSMHVDAYTTATEFLPSCKVSKIRGSARVPRSQAVQCVEVSRSSLPVLLPVDRSLLPGLGHGISNCPKLEDTQRRQMASHRISDDRGGY